MSAVDSQQSDLTGVQKLLAGVSMVTSVSADGTDERMSREVSTVKLRKLEPIERT